LLHVVEPPSILLLPAAGPESARHFDESVATAIPPDRLDEWFPADAEAFGIRVTNRLGAWGLRDNTKNLPGSGVAPIIWDRIQVETLALFSGRDAYFCAARVIGKGTSEAASFELWGSPEFRWLVLLSDIREVAIPLDVVSQGAGFSPSYKLNRQALVPKEHREPTLLASLCAYLPLAKDGVPTVEEVPPEEAHVEVYELPSASETLAARRREAALVGALRDWWRRPDGPDAVLRLRILTDSGRWPLYVDLYNKTTNELVEAKGTCSRQDIRMAIGQLADYRRFVRSPPRCVILLPQAPAPDLIDLLEQEGIGVIVPDGSSFREVRAPEVRHVQADARALGADRR
jgi:hypothetical protein